MSETLHREVTVEIAAGGDGRTLESRLVPYNQVATVNDGDGPYQELFLPGAFRAQMRAAHRIKAFLNFRHRQGLSDVIGHAIRIDERDDGLHGELRVLDVPDGDKALRLVEAGVLDKLSIEFQPLKQRIVDGVVQRTAARLLGVALVPEGAYPGAEVLAVREPDEIADETEPMPDFDAGLAARLARFLDLPVELRLLERAFTEAAWDGSPGRWPDAASYCRSSLIDDNPAGAEKTKALCHLPIREPGSGDVNINAVRNALARVDQVQTSAANKARARATLERLLAQFNNRAATPMPMMPSGMAEMPAGVTACSMDGRDGYKAAGRPGNSCHTHDGTEASMAAAMRRAINDRSGN